MKPSNLRISKSPIHNEIVWDLPKSAVKTEVYISKTNDFNDAMLIGVADESSTNLSLGGFSLSKGSTIWIKHIDVEEYDEPKSRKIGLLSEPLTT